MYRIFWATLIVRENLSRELAIIAITILLKWCEESPSRPEHDESRLYSKREVHIRTWFNSIILNMMQKSEFDESNSRLWTKR